MYLDTAAILKLYVHEPDSEAVVDAVSGRSLCSSWLATPELFSALLAKERSGAISALIRGEAWSRWHQHVALGQFQLIPIHNQVLHRAWGIMQQCHPHAPLRTLDAIHLASFSELEDAGPLLTTDARMIAAARHLGLEVLALPQP